MEDKHVFKNGKSKKFKKGLSFQKFYAMNNNFKRKKDGKKGYPIKQWFWGAYYWGIKGNFIEDAFEDGDPDDTRCDNSGFKDCDDEFWWQHDYFMHNGKKSTKDPEDEGYWLKGKWYEPANGGFDGRWVPLFKD